MSKQNYTNEYIWRYIYTVVTYVSLFVIAHDMRYRMCRGCCTYHRGTSGAGSHYHWLEALEEWVWAVHSTHHFISRQQGTGYIVVSVKKLFLWVCSFPMLCAISIHHHLLYYLHTLCVVSRSTVLLLLWPTYSAATHPTHPHPHTHTAASVLSRSPCTDEAKAWEGVSTRGWTLPRVLR